MTNAEPLLIRDIPGAQPEGVIDGIDMYSREKSAGYVAENVAFLISPEAVDTAAASGRAHVLSEQPADQQAHFLTQYLQEVLGDRDFASCRDLGHTALTDLFASQHNVDIKRYVRDSGGLYVQGSPTRFSGNNMVSMNYGIVGGEYSGHFWQLNIDRQYGFANLHCVGPLSSLMLRGNANIIGIDGVADALQQDITLLKDA